MIEELRAYRDDGPIAEVGLALAGPRTRAGAGRFAWAVPPLLRVAEYGYATVLAAGGGGGAVPAVFVLLLVVALHHYDVVYRLRHRGQVPSAVVRRLGLGWDGRMLLLSAAAASGVLAVTAWVMAAALAVLFVTDSVAAWVRPSPRPDSTKET